MRAKRATFTIKVDKSSLKCKNSQFGEFLKSEVGGQTVLPDMSILIGQNLVENAWIKKFKGDILSNFQTV